jgi:hypothetical protein
VVDLGHLEADAMLGDKSENISARFAAGGRIWVEVLHFGNTKPFHQQLGEMLFSHKFGGHQKISAARQMRLA